MRAPFWHAELSLGFARRGPRTVLADNRHCGPLRVQKALYPESPAVCHAAIVHPPAGIAGGDRLDLHVQFLDEVAATKSEGPAHALLTSPGAAKWYRSGGNRAFQNVSLAVRGTARLEWLPQETIVFDGAEPVIRNSVCLDADATACGWDILCLGRRAAGERFASGELRQHSDIARAGKLIWRERLCLPGGSPLLDAPSGLQGRSVLGTFWLSAPQHGEDWLSHARAAIDHAPDAAITQLPGVLLARCLGDSAIAVRETLTAVWHALRPLAFDQAPITPRLWQT